ncbi:autoinducer binding domain-containing protein [Cupriavidus alkaliphilus]|uniref:autoinducer binding domain-containing protein n=1 Tax=Cupriavidus alkaliphilus TaxID=942866 RepID=UPI000DC552FB|nr:autoinducer binding domain-containing protein [Cupriavidus alkaliphilus]RAS01792.1 LuxR family transcriptional regulator [Cupriavidus alkaliphilus]
MKPWQGDHLRLVSSAEGIEDTFATILSEVKRLEFDFCAFGMRSPVPMTAPRLIWCSNYPAGWRKRYKENAYWHRDPTVIHAIVSDEPVLWSDELFARCSDIQAEARAHGLVYGLTQPRRDAHGIMSLLSCVRTEPAITHDEFLAKIERMHWLSHLCHAGMLKHWRKVLCAYPETELSSRELEVLRWSCDGKTSADIAQIIGVSLATVNFHTRNACQKLGAVNKTSAAVRAALLGLLW